MHDTNIFSDFERQVLAFRLKDVPGMFSSIFRYSLPPLGIFVIVYGVLLNESLCLAPMIACNPKISWTCQAYTCPQILWPYVSGIAMVLFGVLLWTLPLVNRSRGDEAMGQDRGTTELAP